MKRVFTKRGVLWLCSVAGLLLVMIGGLFWMTRDWRSPSRTLEAFCRALVARDYATAYAHLGQDYQKRLPYAIFVEMYSSNSGAGPVAACRVDHIRDDGFLFGTSGTLDLTYADGTSGQQSFMLGTEYGLFWKLFPDSP